MLKKPTYEELEKRVQELTKNQDKYELITETIVHGVQEIDTTGIILFANSAFHKMCGHENGNLIGRSIYDLLPDDTDLKVLRDYIKTLIKEQPEPEPWFGKMIKKNGTLFHIQTDWNYKLNRHGDVIGFISIITDITERKKAETSLKKAALEWTLAMDASEDVIYLLDNDRCVVQANSAFYKSMGGTPDQTIGRHIAEIIHPQGEDDSCPICLAQKENRDFVKIMEADTPDNPVGKPIEIRVKILYDEEETPSGILMNLHDLTTSRAADQKLLDSEKKLATLLNATSEIAFLAESDGTFLAFNNALAKSLGVKKEELVNNSMYEFSSIEDIEKRKLIIQKGIESKKPFQWKDDQAGRYFDNSVYPILDNKGDVKQIALFARDITAEIKMKETLQEKESHYRHLFNSLPYGGEVIDMEGKITNCSESTLRLLGYEMDEIIGKHITNFVESDTIKIFKENFPKILKGERYSLEGRMIHKNGSKIDVLRSAQPIFNAAKKVVGMLTLSVDITDRKQAEERLRQYEHIISATNDHMSLLNIDYSYLAVNNAYLIAHKKESSQIIGHNVVDFLGAEIFEKFVKEKLDRCLEGEEIHYQDWFNFPEVGRRYMDVTYYPYTGTDGIISGVVVSSHDITENKLAEENFRNIFEYAPIGIFTLDTNGNPININKSVLKILGSSSIEQTKKLNVLEFENLHKAGFSKNFKKCLTTRKTVKGEGFYTSYWNKQLFIRYMLTPIFDKKNTIKEIQCLIEDFTEHKQIEKKLKYSKLQLEAVLNNIDASIYITDMDSYEILFMNDYMKKEFGKDLTGKICWKSIHENQNGACNFCTNDKLIDATGNPKEPYIWEFHNQTLNRWYELHDQAIPWTDGRFVRMEIAVDITERKKAEKEVLAKQKLNDLLLNSMPYPIMLINKKRIVVAANKIALDTGVIIGEHCWKKFGKCEYLSERNKILAKNNSDDPQIQCTFCMMDEIFKTKNTSNNPAVDAFGKIWDTYWVPLNENEYLHYLIDITERKKAEEQIAASLNEKVVLLREIHHRVKNNMQVIVSLLRMHGRRIKDKNLGKVFEDCRDRINAMSLIHESLYQSEDLAEIDFRIYLKKLCRNLGQAYGASNKGIFLTVGECNVALDIDQGIAIGMVITELITNSFKHAFPLGKGGIVSINLSELDEENVQLIIKDDGKGMPPEIDIMNSPSLGLQLTVAAVTKELGGTIEVKRDRGTQFTICFKYKRK